MKTTHCLFFAACLAFAALSSIAQTAPSTTALLSPEWTNQLPAPEGFGGATMWLVINLNATAPNLQVTNHVGVARLAALPGTDHRWRKLDAEAFDLLKRGGIAEKPVVEPKPTPDNSVVVLLGRVYELLREYFEAEAK